MIPRRDPETRPQTAGYQIIRRSQPDPYGAERGYRGHPRRTLHRPLVTRNGLPAPGYRYRGTGRSMTPGEAEQRLATR